eukprot:jgi/Chrzof1/2405/Cz11g14060.t1
MLVYARQERIDNMPSSTARAASRAGVPRLNLATEAVHAAMAAAGRETSLVLQVEQCYQPVDENWELDDVNTWLPTPTYLPVSEEGGSGSRGGRTGHYMYHNGMPQREIEGFKYIRKSLKCCKLHKAVKELDDLWDCYHMARKNCEHVASHSRVMLNEVQIKHKLFVESVIQEAGVAMQMINAHSQEKD